MSVVIFRRAVWGLIALLLAVMATIGLGLVLSPSGPGAQVFNASGEATVGGPFEMVSHTGETVTDKTYAGKAWLMFLGFTHCPDICPTTLAEMSSWFDELGPEADELIGFLVTVDPERDTVDVLRQYVSSFDERIVALRPDQDQLERFAKDYKVYYAKVPGQDGGYTMDHTAGVMLFDKAGEFAGTVDLHEPKEVALQKIRRLLD